MPQAIIFDCDGTLLLSADLHFRAMSAAAQAQGATMPETWYMSMTGFGRHDLFTSFAQSFGLTLDIPRLAADSIALTVELAHMAKPNPPVADLARRCCGKVPIAVATNSETEVVKSLLRATALLEQFDAIITVNDVTKPKPAPDMFLLAAQRLSTNPGYCLVLEDSDQGLDAARSAGMAALDVRSTAAENSLTRLFKVL